MILFFLRFCWMRANCAPTKQGQDSNILVGCMYWWFSAFWIGFGGILRADWICIYIFIIKENVYLNVSLYCLFIYVSMCKCILSLFVCFIDIVIDIYWYWLLVELRLLGWLAFLLFCWHGLCCWLVCNCMLIGGIGIFVAWLRWRCMFFNYLLSWLIRSLMSFGHIVDRIGFYVLVNKIITYQ